MYLFKIHITMVLFYELKLNSIVIYFVVEHIPALANMSSSRVTPVPFLDAPIIFHVCLCVRTPQEVPGSSCILSDPGLESSTA